MSNVTVQIDEHCEAAMEQLRKVLSFGPVVGARDVYEVGLLLRMTGSALIGASKELDKAREIMKYEERMKEIKSRYEVTAESPANAELFGR